MTGLWAEDGEEESPVSLEPAAEGNLPEWVAIARLAALEQMTRLGHNLSACAMARNGQSFPAYKFHEGRMSALSGLTRSLRAGEPELRAVDALVTEWSTLVDRHRSSGRDWQAYAAGGLDAATEARARVTTETLGPVSQP